MARIEVGSRQPASSSRCDAKLPETDSKHRRNRVRFESRKPLQGKDYYLITVDWSPLPASKGCSWTCGDRIDALLLADMVLETLDLFELNSSTFHMRFDPHNERTLVFEPVADGVKTCSAIGEIAN